MEQVKPLTDIQTSPSKAKRNGLIDLYRFFFALVVVKNHSLFVYGGPYFGPGRVCVEFFFILSGFLFYSFLEKNKNEPLLNSLIKLFKSRALPLAIPLCIGVASNVISNFFDGDYFNIWGYLWYVEVMLVEMTALIILRKYIKNDKAFIITIASIMMTALLLKFSGLLYSFGYVRGASSIPMGLLIAMLPRIPKKRKWLIWLLLIPTMVACFIVVCFNLGNVEWLGLRLPELILDNLLYPALIYLTFCLEFECKFFSYLGALSFGLYAFQCPADLFRVLGVSDIWLLFGFILLATLFEDAAKRIYKYRRQKQI